MKLRHRHEVSRQSFTKSAQNRLSLRGRSPRRCGSVFVRKPALQLDRGRYYFPRCAPLRAAPSPLVRQTAWHTRGENMEGATPPFSGAGAPRGGESNFIPNFTLTPLPRGGRSLSSDPCGKAEMPIQEASALMPRDSSDWMPKASMTSARLQQWEPTRRRVDAAWLYSPMFLRQDRGGYVTWRARRF